MCTLGERGLPNDTFHRLPARTLSHWQDSIMITVPFGLCLFLCPHLTHASSSLGYPSVLAGWSQTAEPCDRKPLNNAKSITITQESGFRAIRFDTNTEFHHHTSAYSSLSRNPRITRNRNTKLTTTDSIIVHPTTTAHLHISFIRSNTHNNRFDNILFLHHHRTFAHFLLSRTAKVTPIFQDPRSSLG